MQTEQLEGFLAQLPLASPFRVALSALVSEAPDAVNQARTALQPYSRPYWEEPIAIEEQEALGCLRAALGLKFPQPESDWEGPRAELLLFALIGSVYPSLLEEIANSYARTEEGLRGNLLTLLASAASPAGAELLVKLLREHAWPSPLYQRFLTELSKNLPHAELLFPALLELPGGPWVALADLALRALREGSLKPEVLEASTLGLSLGSKLQSLLEQHLQLRGRDPEELSEEELAVAETLAVHLDLAGFISTPGVLAPLRAAATLPENWPAMFALTSLLRRREPVPREAVERIASDPALRVHFWTLLRALGAQYLLPEQYRTRDAFAEAEMVSWLAHPQELGCPPDELEKMAVFEGELEGHQVVLYVWRFRFQEEGWKAAVSGPYPRQAEEGPLQGAATFSAFEAWEEKDAEGHAAASLALLQNWARSEASGQ